MGGVSDLHLDSLEPDDDPVADLPDGPDELEDATPICVQCDGEVAAPGSELCIYCQTKEEVKS